LPLISRRCLNENSNETSVPRALDNSITCTCSHLGGYPNNIKGFNSGSGVKQCSTRWSRGPRKRTLPSDYFPTFQTFEYQYSLMGKQPKGFERSEQNFQSLSFGRDPTACDRLFLQVSKTFPRLDRPYSQLAARVCSSKFSLERKYGNQPCRAIWK
jgi:hypothetical protein